MPTEPTPPSDVIEQTAAAWLARRDAAAWSSENEALLQHWLNEDIRHRVAFLRLLAAWQASDRLQVLNAGQATTPPPKPATRRDAMLHAAAALTPRFKRHPESRRRALLPQVAALAVFAIGALLLGWAWNNLNQPNTTYYQTTIGKIHEQPLPDGSLATLGTASRMQLQLSRNARDVTLSEGEAIFKVAKDPNRPFNVTAGNYRATAVGTRFSVRRDPDDLRIVVTEGTVRLDVPPTNTSRPPSVLLPAGSVATVNTHGLLIRSLTLAEAQHLLDWSDGLLTFNDTPLSEVANEFNRFNTRKLVVADADAGALRIGGRFRWDNEENFVHLLEVGFPVRADYSSTQIVLRSH